MRHVTELFPDREVVTYTGDGFTRQSYGELVRDAARLANALRGLGVTGDQRVATFMWNNAAHLAAYLAVPSMGAVLHTLNIRLYPEQMTYIANQAEDTCARRRLADPAPGADPAAAQNGAARDRRRGRRLAARRAADVRDYRTLLDAAEPTVRLAGDRRELGRRHVLHQRHHRQPQGRRLQPPLGLPALDGGLYGQRHRACPPADRVLPIVPMFHANAWGLPYAALMAGAAW